MAMAPGATRATGGTAAARLVSKSGFSSVPSLVRLPRRAGGNRLRVAARGRRPDGWGAADSGSSSSGGGGGRLVDADMATLRRRIREARAESAEEDGIDADDADADDADAGLPLPAGWTELERRHHGSYVAGVRGAVGLLEALLVSARPGLGAGVLAMLLLGAPASLFLVCANLIRALDSLSSGLPGR